MEREILRGMKLGRRLATASLLVQRHAATKLGMRYLLPAAFLFVAACAPRPEPVAAPVAPAAPAGSAQHDHRSVNGMTAGELIQHFGKPRLQIIEGEGTKLQFAGPNCVLDVYLYPPSGGGTPRATLIEARNSQGNDVSAQSCAAAIERH
jgi:hypothetical protein